MKFTAKKKWKTKEMRRDWQNIHNRQKNRKIHKELDYQIAKLTPFTFHAKNCWHCGRKNLLRSKNTNSNNSFGFKKMRQHSHWKNQCTPNIHRTVFHPVISMLTTALKYTIVAKNSEMLLPCILWLSLL